MKSIKPLQALFFIWAGWELVNGVLSLFAAPIGGSLVSWAPKSGWNADLYAMSQQYGLAMIVLGLVYLVVASNPVRYLAFVWVVVAEQVLGIVITAYETFGTHSQTVQQLLTQVTVNVIIAAVFLLLRPSRAALLGRTEGAAAT
ncbi:MAG: hypothetical protein WAJ85_06115 [Candidatus Baltobacteraceae bacterium]|jgi:hypothetical protein